jgi:hypothetical protein
MTHPNGVVHVVALLTPYKMIGRLWVQLNY